MSRVALTPSTDGRMLDRRHSLNILQKDPASALIMIMMTMRMMIMVVVVVVIITIAVYNDDDDEPMLNGWHIPRLLIVDKPKSNLIPGGGFGTEVHFQGGEKITATPVAWIVGARKSSELLLDIEIRTVEIHIHMMGISDTNGDKYKYG